MWHKKNQESVSIVIHENMLSLAWLQWPDQARPPHLKAYKTITLQSSEIVRGIIYNPTAIKTIIQEFLMRHNIAHIPVLCAIKNSIIIEKYFHTASSELSPEIKEFFKSKVWNYCHLGSTIDHDSFVVYACGLPREYMFHYRLFALFAQLNLLVVTTTAMAQFMLYKYIYGAAFRQSQLSVDLARHTYDLTPFFTADSITRVVSIPSDLHSSWQSQAPMLASALGLFVAKEVS
jgi:hypothetical protein